LLLSNNGDFLAVKLKATGRENALSFSVSFDPAKWRFLAAENGRDMQQTSLIINSTELSKGRVGILIALPGGQTLSPGDREVVILKFALRHNARWQRLIAQFEDLPVVRDVVDVRANPIR